MKFSQSILLVIGAVAVALMFLFARTKPAAVDIPSAGMMSQASTNVKIDFNDLLQKAKATLSPSQKDSIQMLELQMMKVRGDKEQANMLEALGDAWTKTGNIIVAGKYFADAAIIKNDTETWKKAAERFLIGFPNAADSSARLFAAQSGADAYKKLSQLDSSNLDYKIHEAECLVDGLGQVMNGVLLLKEVEQRDSNNEEMNTMLGRLAVVSGQYDKAIARLTKVIRMDPKNAEAYFHLAEAYRAMGRKDEAVKTLEQCKAVLNDTGLNAQIDNYINQIKNS